MAKARLLALSAAVCGFGGVVLALSLLLSPARATLAQGEGRPTPVVGNSIDNDVLPELAAIAPLPQKRDGTEREIPLLPVRDRSPAGVSARGDGALDAPEGSALDAFRMPAPGLNFEGVPNVNGVLPPDTNGDVGLNHYVQWVNLSFAIYNKQTGALVYGPANGNTLWQGFGGPCEDTNDGDPIVLYDSMAQRWLMSQFALPNFPDGPFYQCIAISQTSDPLGAYHRYAFLVSQNKMNDYPHFGVWPDGYYMSVNQFEAGSLSWAGAGVYVFDRSKMLAGQPATFQYFDLYGIDSNFGGMLPSDLDGGLPPPPGTPNYFAEVDDANWIGPNDAMRLWQFHVDWANPANSTFGLSGQPNAVLPTAAWDPMPCCIPQPATDVQLDVLGDRLMHRLSYRNFGSYQTLLVNHTVDAGGGRAGIRWYEVRNPGGATTIHQQGTYAPNDGTHRWMGSVAMDHNGNVAAGYSVSSSSVYPSIRYAGRLAGDPPGTLPQAEVTLIAGGGAQTHPAARWGDYSAMAIDPVDDCTFWYTTEYMASTSSADWQTRIGSFRYLSCSLGPQGTLAGSVTNASNGAPLANAQVEVLSGTLQLGSTSSNAQGGYRILLPTGVYNVRGSKYGFQPLTIGSVAIVSGTTRTQNLPLSPAPFYVVSGTLRDTRSGWPLYASLSIEGYPGGTIWNNPTTGFYSITLAAGITYTFNVNAWVDGYLATSVVVPPLTGNRTQNIGLNADASTCNAPGYQRSSIFSRDFEANNGGFGVFGTTSWAWGVPSSGPGNAYSGSRVWATNLSGEYSDLEDGYIRSPSINLSTLAGQNLVVVWQQWLESESFFEHAMLDVSNNNGSSWTTVYDESGSIDLEWTQHSVVLDPSYAVSNFRVRFRFTSDGSVTYPGWYIDSVGVGALNACNPQAGGLVVGNVYDANTHAALIGARVALDSGASTPSAATVDPAVADSFYTLFTTAGTHTISATMESGYGAAIAAPTVVQSSTIRQDLNLPAGLLSYTPQGLQATLAFGAQRTLPLTLTNHGGLSANFELVEINKGFNGIVIGPFHPGGYVVKPFRQHATSAQGLKLEPQPSAPPYAAGDVIQSWQSDVEPWGIAYDAPDATVWLSSPASGWFGNNTIYEYSDVGSPTGRSYPYSWSPSFGPADAAYQWNTNSIWVMNVADPVNENCIYEMDPEYGYTGERICPQGGFDVSQRGLAYDPTSDTYFAGSWNDAMVYRFDSQGNLLANVFTGLNISGLAYNPNTQHLFVMTSDVNTSVYVLDVGDNYTLIGQFPIAEMTDFGGAGLEIDCDGYLWAVDQNTDIVYQFESGESTTVCAQDVPWLSEAPLTSGSLTPSARQVFAITINAGVPEVNQPGQYLAQLKIQENTPYSLNSIPVTLTVNPPSGWGEVHGRIFDLGYCDRTPSVLAGAMTQLTYGAGLTHTFTQKNEPWIWWAPAGPMNIVSSAAGYVTQTTQVEVLPGSGLSHDVNLRWLHNCGGVSPESLDLRVPPNIVTHTPIELVNLGTLPWSWSLSENSSWLTVTGGLNGTTQADARQTRLLQINTAGMSLGSIHSALLTVAHDDDQRPSPFTVLVRITIAPVPAPLNIKLYLPLIVRD